MNGDPDRELVRAAVAAYLGEAAPRQAAELDLVFDLVYDKVTAPAEADAAEAGDRGRQGLPIDGSFVEASLLTSAVWAASLLVDSLRRRLELRDEPLHRRIDRVSRRPGLSAELWRRLAPAAAQEPNGPAEGAMTDAGVCRLHVRLRSRDGLPTLFYEVTSVPDGLLEQDFGNRSLEVEPARHFRERLRYLESPPDAGPEAARAAGLQLEATAVDLARKLLPGELQELLRSMAGRVEALQVVSREPWIPWEVLALPPSGGGRRGPFLADAFHLTRWLPGPAPPRSFDLSRWAVIAVRGGGLAEVEPEAVSVLELAARHGRGEEVPARFLAVVEAMARGEHDVWHFAGHGQASRDADATGDHLQLEGGERLRPEHLAGEAAEVGRRRPLVYLSSCSGAHLGSSLSGLGGWPAAFLEVGAGAFVAPLWPVGDRRARAFAEAFYGGLGAGARLVDAMRGARAVLAAAHPGDAARLAYVLYADPAAVVPSAAIPRVEGVRP